ncbi:MAG: hypothetical protein COV31_01030 [Candidatus Yanofskybacteria bacterium CG10_big_fil_rev_8_21_14_0_10_46_23]|uniref:GtrA/DPMS transmembrane domain-containing protein n=1 Tax=Candidatus Yanofskybacteria bacterium CG10_big_fil_rev_8_21_14_0_10_46_23 TaxID=1975098 RepID=A0A2H0R4I6_9BACT|nr:MAG: hypothetical protein COV31_01030 [Candidatus Yanofskybacteria bacterium CG10_big_fil_rev_8_21_14_0_10_46_23]
MTKRDFIFAIITGLLTGLVAGFIFRHFQIAFPFDFPYFGLVIFVPILWILGVWLGNFLGRWVPFFSEFGRFVAIGFTNAAVDFGILNLLINLSGLAQGTAFSVFKSLSFLVALTHSYFWNRFWVFHAREQTEKQFTRFFGVNLVALVINVSVASAIVNLIPPLAGLSAPAWANLGAVAGSGVALIFSFVGFRTFVFKKNP